LIEHPNIKQAIVWYENKEFSSGVSLLDEIADQFPKNIVIPCYLGLNHQKLGGDQLAIDYFNKTIDIIFEKPNETDWSKFVLSSVV
jgi:hypothetical protein